MKGDILETKCPECGGILKYVFAEDWKDGTTDLISCCVDCKVNWKEVYKMTPYGIKIINPIERYFVG